MPYKVFLVEDEIVTREGIRDNVNWQGAGFVFCGEAPDGELALPLIQSLQPDLLITDIKMPFMDGLQLSRIVRAQMPDVRIVILSGHDEFQYAREAISLGVSDYLLKPLGVRELEALLRRIGKQIDDARAQQQRQRMLEAQVEEDLALRRDRFLMRLLTVGVASDALAPDALLDAQPGALPKLLEEARTLGLEMHAALYQVMIVRSEFGAGAPDFTAQEAFHAQVLAYAASRPAGAGAWLTLRKDVDESVLVALGASDAQVETMLAGCVAALERIVLAGTLRFHVGKGSTQSRFHMLNQSYSAAQYDLHATIRRELAAELAVASRELAPGERQGAGGELSDAFAEQVGPQLVNLKRAALADYLRVGLEGDFETMFARYMGALDQATLCQPLVEQYVRTDMALTIAKFVIEMGGNPDHLFVDLGSLPRATEAPLRATMLKQQLREACLWAIDLRDHRAANRNAALIQRAQRYLETNYGDSALSLGQVASEIGLSPNHFSAVFSAETGETFRDALTRIRIEQARILLRSTPMTNSEVSDRVGYSDPHYFGAVFKRVTGQTPQQYRSARAEAV